MKNRLKKFSNKKLKCVVESLTDLGEPSMIINDGTSCHLFCDEGDLCGMPEWLLEKEVDYVNKLTNDSGEISYFILLKSEED